MPQGISHYETLAFESFTIDCKNLYLSNAMWIFRFKIHVSDFLMIIMETYTLDCNTHFKLFIDSVYQGEMVTFDQKGQGLFFQTNEV